MITQIEDLPFPFIVGHKEIIDLSKAFPFPKEIPSIEERICALDCKIPGVKEDYQFAIRFLSERCMKSKQTFNGFRTEIERFLLWAWIIKKKPLEQVDRSDAGSFIEFFVTPPKTWAGIQQEEHFKIYNGELTMSEKWRPFRVSEEAFLVNSKKVNREPSQSSLQKMLSILSVFYKFQIESERNLTNFMPSIKKNSNRIETGSIDKTAKVLSEKQWISIIDILTAAADENPMYERNLFAVVTLKSLYLRISEISSRPNWQPKMKDFTSEKNGEQIAHWFHAFGKRNKHRQVTVPNSYLTYLKRYRNHCGLSDFPAKGEDNYIFPKLKGKGGIGIRQATRLIEDSFSIVQEVLEGKKVLSGTSSEYNDVKPEFIAEIKMASSHWLRHTGASMDVNTRPLRHLADDLGHQSISTTDKVYIQSAKSERAESGIGRKI